jgi:hypothetical protein
VIRAARALVAAALAISLVSCAHRPRQLGVPIEQRPTPRQPSASDTARAPAPSPTAGGGSLGTAMGAAEREQSVRRIVADTTAASAAVRKCAGKTLLPDQESVFETTRGYLIQARAALKRGELWEAESLARKARQLALSLECY